VAAAAAVPLQVVVQEQVCLSLLQGLSA